LERKRAWLIVIALLAASTLACWGRFVLPGRSSRRTIWGAGPVLEEDRSIRGVRGVDLATVGTLTLELGERETLRVEAEESLLPYLETEVREGTLVIRTRQGKTLRATQPIRYHLTLTGIDRIAVSSAGDIEAAEVTGERMRLTVSSAGDLRIGDLRCTELDVTLSSAGDLVISELHADEIAVRSSSAGDIEIGRGAVERQEVRLSSAGDYRARGLESAEAEVELTSAGGATIRVRERVGARLTSSGDLLVYGRPTIEQATRSSGRVLRQGD